MPLDVRPPHALTIAVDETPINASQGAQIDPPARQARREAVTGSAMAAIAVAGVRPAGLRIGPAPASDPPCRMVRGGPASGSSIGWNGTGLPEIPALPVPSPPMTRTRRRAIDAYLRRAGGRVARGELLRPDRDVA